MQQQEIKALLSDMSLEEKIGELFQLPSYFFNGDMVTGPAGELGITPDDLRVSGSCLSVAGAERVHEIQQRHIEKHRTYPHAVHGGHHKRIPYRIPDSPCTGLYLRSRAGGKMRFHRCPRSCRSRSACHIFPYGGFGP